jgi:hypothetical protein
MQCAPQWSSVIYTACAVANCTGCFLTIHNQKNNCKNNKFHHKTQFKFMSSTQVSQTLFRFVSVRNPQLTDHSGKDKRFVFRSDEVKKLPAAVNVFDAAIATGGNSSKLALLAAAAVPFKSSAAYLADERQ